MRRCFLALELDAATKRQLRGALDPLIRASRGDRPRILAEDSYHITLKFLGSLPQAELTALSLALPDAIRGRTPFESTWAGFGGLPRRSKAHVLVAVLRDDLGLASELERDVARVCGVLGFADEPRAFKPHATVARFKKPVDVRHYLSVARAPQAAVRLDTVTLYESELAPGGARYAALARFPLHDADQNDRA